MTTILMPIKPKYVDKILKGEKKYEYRKIKPNRNVNKMIIYSTSPVKKVVAEVEVKRVIEDTPNNLWNKTGKSAGANKESYDSYFKNKPKAIAYELGKVTIYNKPKTLNEIGIDYIPQSYTYLD